MFDLESLISYAQDAMDNEAQYQLFSKKITQHWIPSMDGSLAYDLGKRDAKTYESWNALAVMCRMLDVDQKRVMSLARSVRRYEEHGGKYDRVFSYGWGVCRRMLRYISPVPYEKTHYASTGNPIR